MNTIGVGHLLVAGCFPPVAAVLRVFPFSTARHTVDVPRVVAVIALLPPALPHRALPNLQPVIAIRRLKFNEHVFALFVEIRMGAKMGIVRGTSVGTCKKSNVHNPHLGRSAQHIWLISGVRA